MSVNSRLKVIWIIGLKKAFQRIPESSCMRKETVEKTGNGDRKIMQSTRITRRPPS